MKNTRRNTCGTLRLAIPKLPSSQPERNDFIFILMANTACESHMQNSPNPLTGETPHRHPAGANLIFGYRIITYSFGNRCGRDCNDTAIIRAFSDSPEQRSGPRADQSGSYAERLIDPCRPYALWTYLPRNI